MSYEGYEEYLCANGHYHIINCFDSWTDVCPFCKSKMKYYHAVDITNGQDELDPRTFPAEKLIIGFDDDWQTDHYGNRYSIKINKYAPYKDAWKKIKD